MLGALGPYDVVTAAAFADMDEDGKLDLFRSSPRNPSNFVLIRGFAGTEGPSPRLSNAFTDATRAWGFDTAHGKCLGVAVRAADAGRGIVLYAANDESPATCSYGRTGHGCQAEPSTGWQGGMGTD